ncbi:MAG: GNAT family N-acetyltransferase [Meiothermus silvanus]|nr:GNAT family N-acetyltransferase [Allomeiothermus silvanus]
MNVILQSHDQRFAVVHSEPWMAEALAEIQEASFPDLAPQEKIRPEHYRSHIDIFPEGQHAVIEVSTGRVVACSTDLRTRVDFAHFAHKYLEAVGGNYLTTHDPKGDWLYGADIGVHPDYRGLGLSTLLYNARHRLVRELGLKGHVAGAMPKGYGALKEQMPIEVYVHKVVRGELTDPVLSVQLKRGYAVWGIIPDYLEDASCANYGVFIVWRNPEVAW